MATPSLQQQQPPARHHRKQQQVEGSCGLKNSGCPPTVSPSPKTIWDFDDLVDDEDSPIMYRPFEFVHGIGLQKGLWSLPSQQLIQKIANTTTTTKTTSITPYKDIYCPIGGYVVFYFDAYWHDVIESTTRTPYTPTTYGDNITNGTSSSSSSSSSGTTTSSTSHDESVCYLLSDGTTRKQRQRRRRRRVLEDENNSSTITTTTDSDNTNDNDESYFLTYYHQCTKPGTTSILTCTTPGHCQAGQYVKVHTSSTVVVTGKEFASLLGVEEEYMSSLENSTALSSDKANNNINSTADILHVTTSLEYIYQLVGRRVDPSTGWIVMDRGYETDLNANITSTLIKDALQHCPIPEFENDDVDDSNVVIHSSSDDDEDFLNSTVTTTRSTMMQEVECRAILYTLLGYIQRQKPTPNFTLSEQYYREALEEIDDYFRDEANADKDNTTTTLLPSSHWCATQSYLVQLYLQQFNWCMAEKEWKVLCRNCMEHNELIEPVLKYYRDKSQLAEEENNEEFLDWSKRFFIQPDLDGEMDEGGCPETFWPTMTPTMSMFPTDSPTVLELPSRATVTSSAVASQRLGRLQHQHQGQYNTFGRLELILFSFCSWWWFR